VVIRCAIKHRFSDFIVNEIDEHGNVVWFRPENDLLKWRAIKEADSQVLDEQGQVVEQKLDLNEIIDEDLDELKTLLQEDDYKRFREYLTNLRDATIEKSTILVLE
jgi:hypothetical protein